MSVFHYNTVTTFFDESGKFKDHKVIAFGGVASYNEDFLPFANEWARLLFRNGLPALSGKNILNAKRPLSRKNSRLGIRERNEDLAPFITCIRTHLQIVIGMTIDVVAFEKLPSHFFQAYGGDPIFVAFARSILEVIEFTPDNDKISFTCDDEEKTAFHLYRLYRRIKKVWPDARKKFAAITFADDKALFALQAADLVSSIMRLEANRRWHKARYDYLPLFRALSRHPQRGEKLWNVLTAFADTPMLRGVSDSLNTERERQNEKERQRMR